MIKFNIYSIITIIVFFGYGFFLLKANFVIKKLSSRVNVPRHWNGRISVVELKKLILLTDDVNLIKEANRAFVYKIFSLYRLQWCIVVCYPYACECNLTHTCGSIGT